MALPGRIEGAKSVDGKSYDVSQGDQLLRSIPIHEAMTDEKLARVIKQNKWKPL